MKEVHKSGLPKFTGKQEGNVAESWLMSVTRSLSFKEYTTNEKAQIAMSLLIDEALMWWVSIEQKLHITPLQVSWELFEENFRSRYLSEEYKHQQKAAFHAVQQRGRSIEEYEAELCALVHHVDYMADDGR